MTRLITERLEAIANRLERTALSVRQCASRIEGGGNIDEAETIINELLWMLPNLGIQAVISQTIREIQKKDNKDV
jgi:hypothetical protein